MTRAQPTTASAGVGPTGLPLLTPLDVHAGYPCGFEPEVTLDLPQVDDPREALRAALRMALERTPCLVAFSGGRDSSLLLALAADIAARDGLAPPVAITLRYPGDGPATESSWQELVMDELRRQGRPVDWERRNAGVEVDIVGPLAATLLREHRAPVYPPVVGPTTLLTSLARDGALVTGDFGDEVLGGHRAALLRAVWRRRGRRMNASAWLRTATAAPLGPVRAQLLRSCLPDTPWLRPSLRAEVRDSQLADALRQPLAWDASVRLARRPRAVALSAATLHTIADRHRCRLVEPLGDAAFVDAFARHGGRYGKLSRVDAMRLLAGDLLPPAVHSRTDKAYFNRSRFGPATRAFVSTWNGSGVDSALVDPEALQAAWLSDEPPAGTALLLQQAWLASHGVSS